MEHKIRERINGLVSACVYVCLLGTRPWSCGATVQKHQSSGTYQPHTELPQSMIQSHKLHKDLKCGANVHDLNSFNIFICLYVVVCDSGANAGVDVQA